MILVKQIRCTKIRRSKIWAHVVCHHQNSSSIIEKKKLRYVDQWHHRTWSINIEKVIDWKIVIGGATEIRQAQLKKVLGWKIVIGTTVIRQATLEKLPDWRIVIDGATEIRQATLEKY